MSHQTANFEQLLESNSTLKRFKEIISNFFKERDNEFTKRMGIPEKIIFSVLVDPDASTINPRVNITYPKEKSGIDMGKLNEEFIKSFKSYLFKTSSNPKVYEDFRRLQRKFNIIFDFSFEKDSTED
ncbi:MAG: hypothetical protein ACTSWN_08555 [Promethearchaeota archaeon]